MYLHGIGYERASYPVLSSIAQAIDEHESIEEPIARMEVFVPQSRHSRKAAISSGCRLRTHFLKRFPPTTSTKNLLARSSDAIAFTTTLSLLTILLFRGQSDVYAMNSFKFLVHGLPL